MRKIKIPTIFIFIFSLILGIIITAGYSPLYNYILAILKKKFSLYPYEELISLIISGFLIGLVFYFVTEFFISYFAYKLLKYLITELRKREILPPKFSLKVKTGKLYEDIAHIFNSFLHMFSSVKQDKDKFLKTMQIYLDPSLKAEIEGRGINEIYIGGKKKIATIFFSDLRGFTALTEKHDAKDVIKVLNDYFEMSTKIIDKNRGRVNKYIGDAILAIFEETPKYADYIDCDKAIIAALDIQTNFKFLQKKWQEKIDPTLSIGLGIGLARGEVILGNIGSQERMEYTVIGDTVNLASRLCDVAKDGQVIITEDIYRIEESFIVIDILPPIQIKGKTGLYNIYSVTTRKMIV